jgi:hypothetical protein
VAVEVGLNDPHEPAGAQRQVTPAVSFVVAATVVVPETCRVAAGGVEMATEIVTAGALMATEVWAFFVVSVTEVAIRVTLPPLGTELGATYVVFC